MRYLHLYISVLQRTLAMKFDRSEQTTGHGKNQPDSDSLRMIQPIDFPIRLLSDVQNHAGFIPGSDLLLNDHGGLHISTLLLQIVMGRQIRLRLDLYGNSRHDGCRAMPFSYIVLDNVHRAIAVCSEPIPVPKST